MKLSSRLLAEREFVERSLGDHIICERCFATLKTYADKCTADLSDACPGFLVIEQCKKEFAKIEQVIAPIKRKADAL